MKPESRHDTSRTGTGGQRMIFAKRALLPGGWDSGVRVLVDDGRISKVETATTAAPGDSIVDCLLPGMANVHSHAFQRGVAGLAEGRRAGRESFWTWRETMYRFALSVDPDAVQCLAEMAYVEMLEAGFTRVGEFHYLHRAPDGRPYDDPAELTARIFAAAAGTGIALTHLPVFYAHGGFGPAPASDGQRRFLQSVDSFVDLVTAADRLARRDGDRVGYAPHSLRAASEADLAMLAAAFPDRVVHIHVAEQEREVADCLAFSGERPVAWLAARVALDARWCLIHATHMTAAEVRTVAHSGAVAGLCPVTEANLGDGVFEAPDYLRAGGRLAVGTDSNIRIDLAEELRTLEYGQRLTRRARNVLAEDGGSTGRRLFDAAAFGGAQALGAEPPEIASGRPADLVGLTDPHRLPGGGDRLLDRWIFARDVSVSDVWAAGVHVVSGGAHVARAQVADRFGATLRRLLDGAL